MESAPAGPAPGGGPPLPPGEPEEWFRRAEDFRRRRVWEEAIRLYRFYLQWNPSNLDALRGLAFACEGKSREPGYESYLQESMVLYRKMIALDPKYGPAHDGLLAASAKAGLLEPLIEEYEGRIAKGGEVAAFREDLRKMEAMLIMKISKEKRALAPLPVFVSLLFGLLAPGLGLLSAGFALLVRMKPGMFPSAPLLSEGIFKLSLMFFFSFLAYKVFVYWRVSRS
jgi:tetratricopeptide (TPR) repeat protein